MSEEQLQLIKLHNSSGFSMSVTSFGARVVSIFAPDKNGKFNDIVLGYDSLEKYLSNDSYYGAVVGRYANRIANGKFSLNGKEYSLAKNNGANALHGGPKGFHNVFWKVNSFTDSTVTFSYLSADGEEGYPGNLKVQLKYSLSEANEITMEFEATTDRETIINLTGHSFFNLRGEGNGEILDHELMINADRFCPVDSSLIPSGELRNVTGTPFDFLSFHKIGERINQQDEQLKFGRGYDHNWVLNKKEKELSLAAKVREPISGRALEVWTTEPGLQFYSGNFLSEKEIGKAGKPYLFRSAFCLEPQHFPDSPNHSNFPSTILKPGEVYKHKLALVFKTE